MFGIIIVTYNSEDVIGPCLDSCRATGAPVVVIDNASVDGTAGQVKARTWLRFVRNKINRGFAGAANQGFQLLDCPYVLLLNPDTEILTSLDAVEAMFDDPSVGAATGRLLGVDGEDQSQFQLRRLPTSATLSFEVLGINALWPRNPVNRKYRVGDTGQADVEQPAAAFLMVRASAWESIGGFDEAFHPAWFEDVDFCKRLRAAGWQIAYTSDACVKHLGGHSASSISWSERQLIWYGSLLKYAVKHFPAPSRVAVCGSVLAACVPRALGSVALQRSLEPVLVFSKIASMALSSVFSGRPVSIGAGARRREKPESAKAARVKLQM